MSNPILESKDIYHFGASESCYMNFPQSWNKKKKMNLYLLERLNGGEKQQFSI